ncbi:MAG: hypothetical protein HUU60_09605 [Armatimonadetes bacterium]|nr:hypothetical protein [Armatimonadota bacterium]
MKIDPELARRRRAGFAAAAEIRAEELKAMTPQEKIRALDQLLHFAKSLGLQADDREVEAVRARWIKIKRLYVDQK